MTGEIPITLEERIVRVVTSAWVHDRYDTGDILETI